MRHEAEADRWVDRSQRAELNPSSAALAATMECRSWAPYYWRRPSRVRPWVRTPAALGRGGPAGPTHQVVRARVVGMAHTSQPSRVRRPMVNESCSRGLARSRCRPWSVWAATTRRAPGPPTPRSPPRAERPPGGLRPIRPFVEEPERFAAVVGRSSSVARTLRAQELEHPLVDLLGLVHGKQMPGTRQQLRLHLWHQPGGVSQSAPGVEGLLLVAHQQQGRNRDRS